MMKIRIFDVCMCLCAIALTVVLIIVLCRNSDEHKSTESEFTPIIVVKDAENNAPDVEIFNEDLVSYINENIFLCPECGSVLYLSSSHGVGAASAQFYCHNCGYESAEVYKEAYDPDDTLEDECKHECIEKFKELHGNSFDALSIQISNAKVNDSEKESDCQNELQLESEGKG